MNSKINKNCECEFCKNKKDFELPSDIIDALIDDELIIFAGAGVSTESKKVYPYTLYREIKNELEIEDNLSFSKLMSKFCEKTNGRAKLLQKIKNRFDYVTAFPELERTASEFHRELSTIYPIQNIITTNWDDLFERYCGATPIVFPEDFVFWNMPGRKVLKIHGSINNYGSIVATEDDYAKCQERLNSGLIGSSLKLMLATKYIIFIGYSFGDEDFNSIYNSLIKEMNGLIPHAYIVTLDESAVEKFKDMNITPIITDATYFITVLKEHLIARNLLIPDDEFSSVARMLFEVEEEHSLLSEAFNIKSYPQILYSLCYQDGLIHAFERILALKRTGNYSHACAIGNTLRAYEKKRKEKLKKKVYHDVAYIEGYMNGLVFLLMDEEERSGLPLYFVFGYDHSISTLDEYKSIIQNAKELHKTSYEYASKYVSHITNESGDIVFHHTPFL
ncbi:hypothetical protein HNQ80_004297 [Anaerosolibacter carboniphilus]|uniref:SIR2-like domain-containing protein n=1 Tax=Anaerosolibacter carboniphilus TaxID=1417629 RepID=A0A841KXS8_9FIRM|nr:SIR2 family protein [Anaerosolibacter carboniphilus]MBB6218157.1 hypothetical protein [Anaerosolibacter carboniphilus]